MSDNAVAEAQPMTQEEQLRLVRRNNLVTLTSQSGAKTQLAKLTGLTAANISHRLHGNKIFDHSTADFFCEKLGLPEGWFETPKTEAEIPEGAYALLGGGRKAGAAPAESSAGPKAKLGRRPKQPVTALAPTKAQAQEGASAVAPAAPVMLNMKVAAPRGEAPLAQQGAQPTQATSAPVQPAAAGTPASAVPQAEVPAAPATPSAAAVHPLAASLPAVPPRASTINVAHDALQGQAATDVGPIAEALVRTLASKSRAGRLSEQRALEMLVEIAAL